MYSWPTFLKSISMILSHDLLLDWFLCRITIMNSKQVFLDMTNTIKALVPGISLYCSGGSRKICLSVWYMYILRNVSAIWNRIHVIKVKNLNPDPT